MIVEQNFVYTANLDKIFWTKLRNKENWAVLENFGMYFGIIFDRYYQSFISGREAGH